MDIADVESKFDERKGLYGIDFDAKGEQLQIVHYVMTGENVLGLLPTGFGKTMCVVMPAIITERRVITLIVSPLTALMDDQAQKIKQYGISVATLGPLESMDSEVVKGVKKGDFEIVISSPETALKRHWKDVFLSDVWQERIHLLAIDEAHCISEWGEDFRTDYRMLHELRSILDCPVMALTATTTAKVKGDILKYLHLNPDTTKIVSRKPDRPNIFIDIQKTVGHDHLSSLEWLIDHMKERKQLSKKTVVFCRGVDTVSEIFTKIRRKLGPDAFADGIKDSGHVLVEMYHKCTDEDSKKRILDNFRLSNNNIRCLIATTALGMGLDIPDVDIVVHIGAPKSVLSYWQEVGRCARDGRKGYALTLYDAFTLSRKNTSEDIVQLMKNKENSCIRENLMKNFEGDPEATTRLVCGNCGDDDVCSCSLCACCSYCRSTCPCQEVSKYSIKKYLSA